MTDSSTSPDFGAGLSLDELVGMTAGEILSAPLPNGEVFIAAGSASALMYQRGLEDYVLVEVWADGHTAWRGHLRDDPVIVTPADQLFRTRGND